MAEVHILLVEDEEEWIEEIIEVLAQEGYEGVDVVTSVAEALALLRTIGPRHDLVITGWGIGANPFAGTELIEKIREDERFKKLPIILHTPADIQRDFRDVLYRLEGEWRAIYARKEKGLKPLIEAVKTRLG